MEPIFNSVQDVCAALNDKAMQLNASAANLREQKRIALLQLKVHQNASGLIPSGPRKRGEGCDDENQGIVAAEETPTGGARLRVTLLAAGFVIGPGGSSIRAISQKSGADIRSWNDSLTTNGRTRRVRTIVIEGNHRGIVLALTILCQAIELYKELCEGKYCGKYVDRCQYIHGVEFVYSPPPRSAVPYAAALKPDSGNGSPATETGGSAGAFSAGNGSPSRAVYSPQNTSPIVFQKENQATRPIHALGVGSSAGTTVTSPVISGTAQHSSALSLDPGMVDALETAAKLCMLPNTAVPMVTDAAVASALQAELSSTTTGSATATAASALAAALAGSSALPLLSQPGNMTTMAPDTPFVSHKMYDSTSLNNNSNAAADGSAITANNKATFAATATPANSVKHPTPEFLKLFENLDNKAVNNATNMASKQAVQPPLESSEPVKDFPCYSLFGPDGNFFGPALLRDIWGPDGNGPGMPPIPSWRGMTAVSDDQLNMIGLPSYEDFAEKSPYYSSNSNSLRNVFKSSEVPPLRMNNNGFLFSAYEDNSASRSNTDASKADYPAAAKERYVYYPTNEHHDQVMHDAQQH